MKYTGILYVFYTTKPIEVVFKLLQKEANKKDYHFEYNEEKSG